MDQLHIKNMVCNRCILVVKNELEKLHLDFEEIQLGQVSLKKAISAEDKNKLGIALTDLGFELIDNKKSQIIEQIKTIIINHVHHNNEAEKYNLSEILSSELHHDYSYLSNLFSDVEGITIEKYFIAQKIEKVKELLVYDELSLAEIAEQLNYSSVAYLSSQFKKVTGLTPSHFKKIGQDKRKPLDQL